MHGWAPNRDHEIANGQYCLCGKRQWHSQVDQETQGQEFQITVHRVGGPDIVYPARNRHNAVEVAHNVMDTIVSANDEDRHPIQIEIRSRMVGSWETEAGYTVGTMAPPGWEIRYTNAPDAYFGFGTHILRPMGTRGGHGGSEFRQIAIDPAHLTWQTDRNASGMYLTLTESKYNQYRIDGIIVPIPPPLS